MIENNFFKSLYIYFFLINFNKNNFFFCVNNKIRYNKLDVFKQLFLNKFYNNIHLYHFYTKYIFLLNQPSNLHYIKKISYKNKYVLLYNFNNFFKKDVYIVKINRNLSDTFIVYKISLLLKSKNKIKNYWINKINCKLLNFKKNKKNLIFSNNFKKTKYFINTFKIAKSYNFFLDKPKRLSIYFSNIFFKNIDKVYYKSKKYKIKFNIFKNYLLFFNDYYIFNKMKINYNFFSNKYLINNLNLFSSFNLKTFSNKQKQYNNYYPIFFCNNMVYTSFFNNIKKNYNLNYIFLTNKLIIGFFEKNFKKKIFLKINNNNIYKINNIYFKNILNEFKNFKPSYLKNFLFSDFIQILWYSFFLKDLNPLSDYVSRLMETLNFKNHKKFIIFFQNFIAKYSGLFIDILKIKGFFFDIRGKVGVTGSSKKRHIFFKFGSLNKSSKNFKINYNQNLVRTYSGVLGLTYIICY